MYVIVTKYLGYTDTKSSRIKATTNDKQSVTIEYDQGLSQQSNHDNAAHKLALKLNRKGSYVRGAHPDGKGDVYVRLGVGAAIGDDALAFRI